MLEPGYGFSRQLIVSESDISRFAHLFEDDNPLHHDADFAKASRFGGLIASGPHIMSLFTAMVATHFSKITPMVGTQFSFDFVAPVKPNATIVMSWQIESLNPRRQGLGVQLDGHVRDGDIDLIRGHGSIILLEVKQ